MVGFFLGCFSVVWLVLGNGLMDILCFCVW